MDRSFFFAAALLLLVFVPVLRRCTWRTAAALALVCATVTAVGTMAPWSQFTREAAPGVESRVLLGGIEYGLSGTERHGLGESIRVLGILGAAAAFALTRRRETASSEGGPQLALAAATLLGLAALGTLWEYIGVASWTPVREDGGVLFLRSTTTGLTLTLFASFAGTACAARAYVLLRRAFRGTQAEQRQEEAF